MGSGGTSDPDKASRRERLVEEWIAFQRGSLPDQQDDVLGDVARLAYEEPLELLHVILGIIERRPAEGLLGVLAAGPLEDLVQESGPVVIDEIEEHARENAVFRDLLSRLWLSVDDELFSRVHRAAGSPPAMKDWRELR